MEIKSFNGEANGEAKSSDESKESNESLIPDSSETSSPDSSPDSSPENNVPTPAAAQKTLKRYALIDSTSGVCLSCSDNEAHKTALTCLFCHESFHAVCRDVTKDKGGTDVICCRSFYNSFSSVASSKIQKSRQGNFLFACNDCLTTHENEKCTADKSKVDAIDKRVCSLAESVEQIKQLLTKVVSTPQHQPQPVLQPALSQPQQFVSYASAVATPKPSVFVVDSGLPDESAAAAVEKLIVNNAIHLDNHYQNDNGKHVFKCATPEDRTNLRELISRNYPEAKIHQPLEKLPTISVANLPQQFTEAELQSAVLKAQPNIKSLVDAGEETLKVLKVKKQIKNDKFQASIRVSDNIRRIIAKQNDKVYIGTNCCRVFDNFFVKRCNKCQKFNHYMEECKAKAPVCGHCSGNHASDSCEHVKSEKFYPCCTNCKDSQFDSKKFTHDSFNRSCPSYMAEQDKLRKSMSYYSSKN